MIQKILKRILLVVWPTLWAGHTPLFAHNADTSYAQV